VVIVGSRSPDLDFDYQISSVLGKGRRTRDLPSGRKTALALDRYLRARIQHRHSSLPSLWLGQRGQLTAWGVQQVIRRRGNQAGLPGLHPHQLRHTFCHQWRAEGGSETDLMRLAGWRSPAMLRRYPLPPPTPAPTKPTAASRQETGSSRTQLATIDSFAPARPA
jgi:integrase/recombinase XerC